jgi:hypothetical protein
VLIVVPGERAGKLATDTLHRRATLRVRPKAGRTYRLRKGTSGRPRESVARKNWAFETEKWKLAGQTTIERREPRERHCLFRRGALLAGSLEPRLSIVRVPDAATR